MIFGNIENSFKLEETYIIKKHRHPVRIIIFKAKNGYDLIRGNPLKHEIVNGETQALFRDFVKFSNFRKLFS